MNRKIVSVLVYPFVDGIRVEITRQSGMFDTTKGRLIRWYYANKNDRNKIKSLLRHVDKLHILINKRIGESYE